MNSESQEDNQILSEKGVLKVEDEEANLDKKFGITSNKDGAKTGNEAEETTLTSQEVDSLVARISDLSVHADETTAEPSLQNDTDGTAQLTDATKFAEADVTTMAEYTEADSMPAEVLEGDILVSETTPTSLLSATPAIQKKFTSLNVNRRFLEKASPTIPAVAAPIVNKATSTQPISRLSTISPASRLTSAKLSASIKPQPAGWGQVASALSPTTANPNIDPLPSLSIGTNASGPTVPIAGLNKSGVAPVAASPKLVTTLTNGSVNRSTSPHSKGSPGLRNAALSTSGRTASPSVVTPTISTSSKAPWAKVKADAASSKLSSDFPTAAEAARAKQEAERKEKAAAAEAAAKTEQALQRLERFRGASLGAGNHWDEMDDEDEDDVDEVVQFGDGTQYKVPVKQEEEPVSKEERFKDVGHDRSWPPKAGQARPLVIPSSSNRESGPLSPSTVDQSASRLFNSKVNNKVEIRSGEGISLETETLDRGHQAREGRSFFRNRERENDGPASHHAAIPASTMAAAAPARAWGPLAQRQASLNPDAPKPTILSPPSVPKAASTLPSTQLPTSTSSSSSLSPPALSSKNVEKATTITAPAIAAVLPAPLVGNKGTTNERALPPHLAAQQRLTSNSNSRLEEARTEIARSEIQATPYGARFTGEAGASSRPAPVQEEQIIPSTLNQREEMLSAAERARKRRQEEEEKRLAEKERAKAKAAAIEEKMRLAKEGEERKRKEEMEIKKKEQEETLRAKAEEIVRQRELALATNAAAVKEQRSVAPSILSPSDEAISWRRSKAPPASVNYIPPGTTTSAEPERVTLLQRAALSPAAKSNNAAHSKSSRQTSHNEQDLASSTGMEGWDVVINRIKDSIPTTSTLTADNKIPTGPRLIDRGSRSNPQAQVKLPLRAPRVEIVAPDDEGAARLRAFEEKQREARQSQPLSNANPISVLKPSEKALISAPPEAPTTRVEVTLDAPPVWSRYKIKIGQSAPPVRVPRHVLKMQAIRMANAKNDGFHSKTPNILTWDPPIPNLSTRTLSRDDLFFPKKYRKGTVITNVTIPSAKFDYKPRTAVPLPQHDKFPIVVKVPASDSPKKATTSSINATTGPPRAPASMRGRLADSLNEAVTFTHTLGVRNTTPSPVSFTVTSELKEEEPRVSLPLSTPLLNSTSNVLPSPTPLTTSTWGENSLTFAGMPSQVTADRDHIREVWALSSTETSSFQNSLRGIADEFPDVPAQYHEVGINTGDTHHSAPNSRVYSPLTANDKRAADTSNGFNSLTTASSPSTTKSSPQTRISSSGFTPSSIAKTDSPSNSSFQTDPRRSTSNAFTAYAYPSPLQEFNPPADAGFFTGRQQRTLPPQQQYGGGGGNLEGRHYSGERVDAYGGQINMLSNPAPTWSMEDPTSAASYGMPRQQQQMNPYSSQNGQQLAHHQQRNSTSVPPRMPPTSNNVRYNNNNNNRGGQHGSTVRTPYRSNDPSSSTVW